MSTVVRGVRGVFTGLGFAAKGGKRPTLEDAGFVAGPIDLCFDGEPPVLVRAGAAWPTRAGDRVIDGTDHVALPGWIDSHTHAAFVGEPSSAPFDRRRAATLPEPLPSPRQIREVMHTSAAAGDDMLQTALAVRLCRMRQAGVACVEVKSGFGGNATGELRLLTTIRDAARSAHAGQPAVRTTFLGLHAPAVDRTEAEHVDRMIALLPRIASSGVADFVDAYVCDGFFSDVETRRFVSRARHYRLPARLHCPRLESAETVEHYARLGVASIDDLRFVARDVIPSLARHEWVGTLLPATALLAGHTAHNARSLIDGGVRVALASDFGSIGPATPGLAAVHLLAATALSMSPAEILCASTITGALSLRLPLTAACITPGFPLRHLNLWRVEDSFPDSRPDLFLDGLFLSAPPDGPTIVDLPASPPHGHGRRRSTCPTRPARPDHEDGV